MPTVAATTAAASRGDLDTSLILSGVALEFAESRLIDARGQCEGFAQQMPARPPAINDCFVVVVQPGVSANVGWSASEGSSFQ